MLYLKSKLTNCFTTAGFTNKATGEVQEPKHKLQFFIDTPLKNGQRKIVQLDVTVQNIQDFIPLVGQTILCPVNASIYENKIYYSVPFGSKAEVVKA